MAEHTWNPDNGQSPADFLIGCMEGRWVGEEQSKEDATVACVALSFVKGGFSTEEASTLRTR